MRKKRLSDKHVRYVAPLKTDWHCGKGERVAVQSGRGKEKERVRETGIDLSRAGYRGRSSWVKGKLFARADRQ